MILPEVIARIVLEYGVSPWRIRDDVCALFTKRVGFDIHASSLLWRHPQALGLATSPVDMSQLMRNPADWALDLIEPYVRGLADVPELQDWRRLARNTNPRAVRLVIELIETRGGFPNRYYVDEIFGRIAANPAAFEWAIKYVDAYNMWYQFHNNPHPDVPDYIKKHSKINYEYYGGNAEQWAIDAICKARPTDDRSDVLDTATVTWYVEKNTHPEMVNAMRRNWSKIMHIKASSNPKLLDLYLNFNLSDLHMTGMLKNPAIFDPVDMGSALRAIMDA